MGRASAAAAFALAALTAVGGQYPAQPLRDEIANTLSDAGIGGRVWGTDEAAAARDGGITEERVDGWLERLVGYLPSPDLEDVANHQLIPLLRELGSERSLPLLWKLEGVHLPAHEARGAIRQRARDRSMASCAPPTPTEVAAEAAALADFAAFDVRAGKVVARAPSPSELSDLAYFFASINGAGPEVGTIPEGGGEGRVFNRRSGPNEELEAAIEALDSANEKLEAAKRTGDKEAVATSARAYLTLLGYPGPLRSEEEDSVGWGGARYSYVMRTLAAADEDLGNFAEAAALYRRANPGGGLCGTGVEGVREEQAEGVVRSEEALGHCGAVVAERLALDEGDWSHNGYGVGRLRDAGYDVARLYRGALVTVNRDQPFYALDSAIADGPAALKQAAHARLLAQGPEDWATRIDASGGLGAQTPGTAELVDGLIELFQRADARARTRALEVLQGLRPSEPCRKKDGPTCRYLYFPEISSEHHTRLINPIPGDALSLEAFQERLRPAEAAAERDPDPFVRIALVHLLKAVGGLGTSAALERLAQDSYASGEICDGTVGGGMTNCRADYPVREAVRRRW